MNSPNSHFSPNHPNRRWIHFCIHPIFYLRTLYVSNLCQTQTSKNKVDRSTMIVNIHRRLSSFLCIQLSQWSCLTISSCVVPVQPCICSENCLFLRAWDHCGDLWLEMLISKERHFYRNTEVFCLFYCYFKSLIWNKLDTPTVFQPLSHFCIF